MPADHKYEVTDLAWNRQTGVAKQCVAALYNATLGAIFFDDVSLATTDYCKHSEFGGIVLYEGDQLWVAMLGASAGFCPVFIGYVDVSF